MFIYFVSQQKYIRGGKKELSATQQQQQQFQVEEMNVELLRNIFLI